MKLVVQIPCFNEEETIGATVAAIPRAVEGVDRVEILVVDDGSSDGTISAARQAGVEHIVRHKRNQGLAAAFRTGIETSLMLGADIIVNTDGDNQYCGGDIPKLIAPILAGNADFVVGDRQTWTIKHFSPTKKALQAVGSFVVRKFSGACVPDAVSGFRAFSRDAALRLNVVSSYSYTVETLIQAGRSRTGIASVPVSTNPATRDSRLIKSIPHFLFRTGTTLLRSYAMYQPLRAFIALSMAPFLIGILPIARFVYLYCIGEGQGHLHSLILGGVFVIIGCLVLLVGLAADLISINRELVEKTLEKVKRLELLAMSADSYSGGDSPLMHNKLRRFRRTRKILTPETEGDVFDESHSPPNHSP